MSKKCCIPGCDSKRPHDSLYWVRSKRFLPSGPVRTWAEDLEKIVLGLREDADILHLYHRDDVKICARHFSENDFVITSKTKKLRVGAIPLFHLPRKPYSVRMKECERKPPQNRIYEEKIYHKHLKNFIKAVTHVVSSSRPMWKIGEEPKTSSFYFYKTSETYHQSAYEVFVDENLEKQVFYYGWKETSQAVKLFDLSKNTAIQFLDFLEQLRVCVGIGKTDKTDQTCSTKDNMIVQHSITTTSINTSGLPQCTTLAVRSVECTVFLENEAVLDKCIKCTDFIKATAHLQRMKRKYAESVANKPLKRFNLEKALPCRIKTTINTMNERIEQMKIRVEKALKDNQKNIALSQENSNEMAQCLNEIEKSGEMDEFHTMFWAEQKKLHREGIHQHRYNADLIKFCLMLYAKGPRAYRFLKDLDLFVLPSERTLRRYRNLNRPDIGFDYNLLKTLFAPGPKDHMRYVMLVLDEMKIKEQLVFQRSTSKLVGFVDEESNENQDLASSVLAIYARGVTNSEISYMIGHFPSKVLCGVDLLPIVLKAIDLLHSISNLWCNVLIGDGCTSNRLLYDLLTGSFGLQEQPEFVPHPLDNSKKLHLISDPSHLMKTTRNNLMTSRSNGARLLWNNGEYMQWSTMQDLYCENEQSPECLVDLHKLSYEHIHPNSFEKMSVSLAAQVLSNSVSHVLKKMGYTEFSKFVWNMDRFFDICNSCNFAHKPQQAKFTTADDQRLKWLEEDFVGYIKAWENSVTMRRKRNGDSFTKVEQAKMLLSPATRNGLVFTAQALVNIVKEMLGIGAPYIVLRRVSQDSLESFFGHVRCMGRSNRNPNLMEFQQRSHTVNFNKGLKQSFEGSVKDN